MKLCLIVVLVALGLCSCSRPGEKTSQQDSSSAGVVVKVMKKPLPSDESRRQEFLVDNFFSKPEEEKFNGYTTENWQSNFTAFAEALLQKANDLKLDSASLRQVLNLVRKRPQDKLAYLPVGAYQTSLDGQPVWIITVKWEEYPPASGRNETLPLIHICAIAFDQKTSKEEGFGTCN